MAWVCDNCGNEYPPSPEPPGVCVICSDEREFIPAHGQRWSALDSAASNTLTTRVVEPGLVELTLGRPVGIGQRSFFLPSEAGNVLFEPPGFIGPALVDWLGEAGGVAAITSSHPHLVGASVSLSHLFGSVPVLFNASDQRWITRPDPVIELWSGSREIVPGVRLVQCGGHFPGSSVLHIAHAAGGHGALLTGDTIMVGADRASVSFMRSYPNLIPLPPRLVRGIVRNTEMVPFDRMYSAFGTACIESDARRVLHESAARYIAWSTDEIGDVDD